MILGVTLPLAAVESDLKEEDTGRCCAAGCVLYSCALCVLVDYSTDERVPVTCLPDEWMSEWNL